MRLQEKLEHQKGLVQELEKRLERTEKETRERVSIILRLRTIQRYVFHEQHFPRLIPTILGSATETKSRNFRKRGKPRPQRGIPNSRRREHSQKRHISFPPPSLSDKPQLHNEFKAIKNLSSDLGFGHISQLPEEASAILLDKELEEVNRDSRCWRSSDTCTPVVAIILPDMHSIRS